MVYMTNSHGQMYFSLKIRNALFYKISIIESDLGKLVP